jgi:menaquinone-dependent protoporphyrinogen IX oxidase
MSRVLVAYACHGGRAREHAEQLANRLRAHGHQVELVPTRVGQRASTRGYDAVVCAPEAPDGWTVELAETPADELSPSYGPI